MPDPAHALDAAMNSRSRIGLSLPRDVQRSPKPFEKVTGVAAYEGYGSTECVPMTFNW
jgi:hypothetical protein